MTAQTSSAVAPPNPPSMRRMIVAATIGNILEWFDFVVYGFFAVTIAEVFFPTGNPTVSLLITFGAFGLAYLVRPLGAIVVGGFTDRAGRKNGLLLSIALMTIGTTLMAVTPGYATIGLAAPIIITLARLLQGFSVGGEFGGAVSFLAEHGGVRRGFAASWQFATGGMITLLASLFGVLLTTLLSHQQLVEWGWRLPYIFGILVGPAGLYIRAKVIETPEFLAAEKPTTVPLGELLRRHPLPVLLALGISIISNSSFYILTYIPTYGVKTLHLPASTGFTATLIGGAVLAIGCPLFGHWSDKLSRPLLMVITCWLFVLTPYLAFWLMAAFPSLAACILAVTWLNLIKAGYSGVLPSLMSEQFPVEVRAIGVSLGYSLSVSIFGGLAPLTATWLIAITGDKLSPSYYLIFSALSSLAALTAIQRRRRRSRAELDAASAAPSRA
ncbi:MAG TPA: MFS transporter [Stellaceae bacterium]|jgi:MHS family proline/betaine transporter-like MFS transporter